LAAKKFIPLEAADPEEEEGPVTFTDVVIAIHLEGVPTESGEDGDPVFDVVALSESVIGAFALGCAVGVEYPDQVRVILEQTHPGATDEIVDECRGALTERVAAAREAKEALEAETFIGSLVDAVDEGPHADADTAQNALSMSFEYGCILAHLERSAAIIVRNEYNRAQDEAVADFEKGESDETPEGPDPFHSLQELATEVMEAYEADIGFGIQRG
jgi:hypothetical protein